MRPQRPPRNAGASLPTTPGSCCAAQERYVVAPSVVSAATTPPRPYLKKRDPDTVALRAPLAQLAEQLTLNQRVGGSIPSRRTKCPSQTQDDESPRQLLDALRTGTLRALGSVADRSSWALEMPRVVGRLPPCDDHVAVLEEPVASNGRLTSTLRELHVRPLDIYASGVNAPNRVRSS
jgi:hypothetical protein